MHLCTLDDGVQMETCVNVNNQVCSCRQQHHHDTFDERGHQVSPALLTRQLESDAADRVQACGPAGGPSPTNI